MGTGRNVCVMQKLLPVLIGQKSVPTVLLPTVLPSKLRFGSGGQSQLRMIYHPRRSTLVILEHVVRLRAETLVNQRLDLGLVNQSGVWHDDLSLRFASSCHADMHTSAIREVLWRNLPGRGIARYTPICNK